LNGHSPVLPIFAEFIATTAAPKDTPNVYKAGLS